MMKTLDFYLGVLGLKVYQVLENKILLSPNYSDVILILENSLETPSQQGFYGLDHFALLLPTREDLSRTLRHLILINYPISGVKDHGVSESLYLLDPDKNGLEIYVDRPSNEGYEWNLDAEASFSKDIDIIKLLKVGEKLPFNGLPEQTIIGHLDLKTRDLKRAKKFFIDSLSFYKKLELQGQFFYASSKNYHHHIEVNSWDKNGNSGQNPFAYEIYIPLIFKEQVLQRLKRNGFPVLINNEEISTLDMNKDQVFLSFCEKKDNM